MRKFSQRRIKVLHYPNSVDYAGTSRTCERLMKHLDSERFDVHLLYNETADNNRLSYVSRFLPAKNIHGFWMNERTEPYYAPTETNLHDVLENVGEVDVFHHHRSGFTEFPMLPEYTFGVRHLVETNIFGDSDSLVDLDLSLCVSRFIRSLKQDKRNTEVLYNGVEAPASAANLRDSFGLRADAIVLGRIGRSDANIFDPISLDAYARLQSPDLFYLIVNPCKATNQHVEANGLTNVIFLDRILDDERLSMFYNTIDILAHARRDGETCGCNIQEAMMHGRPVVSHVSGVFNAQAEVIGEGGFVARDVDEYQHYLERLIASKTLRDKVGARARRRANRVFRIDVVTRQLERHYQTLVSGRGSWVGVVGRAAQRLTAWPKLTPTNDLEFRRAA